MIYVGLAISGIGLVLYVTHTILYNHHLRKNDPDIVGLLDSKSANRPKKKKKSGKKEVRVIAIESSTPGWVMLLGLPSIPMFFIGIVIIAISLIIKSLR